MVRDRKVVVITGAASGIGLAFSKVCLQHGMNVVLADNSVTELCEQIESLSQYKSGDVYGVVTDVSNAESVAQLARRTIEHFGQVDWLFNNAGISGHFSPLWQQPSTHIRTVLDVNLHGVINGVQAFMPIFLDQKQPARIINMASMYGFFGGSQVSSYAMSKAAIISLSESLYYDIERFQYPIEVSIVCPSFVDTSLLLHSEPAYKDLMHETFSQAMSFSSSADEVAQGIWQGIESKQFYILPDEKIKAYINERNQAIQTNSAPPCNAIERLITKLAKRAGT